MRFIRYMLVVAALLTSAATRGQINPANPAEPTAPETPAPPAETYALRLETTPAGGGTYNIDASTRYAEGTTVGLRAYPAASFTFVAWEQDGEVLSSSAAYTYTMPARDVVLTARYRFTPGSPAEPTAPAVPEPPVEPDYGTLYLAVLPQGGGSINVGSGNRYEAGSKVNLKATASAGFTFSHWTAADTVLARTASLTYTVPAGESRLAAHFTYTPASPGEPPAPPTPPTPAQYRTLCLVSDPQGGGYFNPQSGGTYEVGSTVKVQAYANQWYTFAGWTSADTVVSASANYSFVMPDGDVTLTAHYTYHYNPSSPGEPSAPVAGQASLYGMTENGLRGQTIVYPVYLENSQPVSGILVDLQFPQGFEVQADRVVLSGRASAHTMDVRQQDDGTYRFFLIGDEPFAGDNGKLFEVPVTIPDTAQTEHNYPVRIARGMNHAADGTLTPISVRSGFIYVGRVSEDGLYARFSYDKLNARVQFTNLSSAVARSFTWDLGDGTTSTDRDPLHVYAEPGTYSVSLTAHGQTGDDVAEMQVLINAPTTWRVDGLFHLGGEGSGVRRFASADELFAFLGNATVTGSLTVGIAAGERHVLALTEEHLAVLRAMQETLAGRDLTLAFVSEGEGPTPILDFGAEGTTADEAVLALFSALGGSLVADGVELRLCGVAFNPDLAVRSVAADRTTVAPGDSLTVTWEVANVGEYATGGGWTEQVTLVSADGADTRLLGTSYHEAPLAAGSVVRRRLAVALPALPGVEGDARIEVRAVGDATTGEAASSLANNTALSEALLQVEKVLRLEVQPSAVDEASAGRVALRLMRSGSWSHAGTFTLTSTADSRVQVPSTLTIAEGQSATVHYLTVVDNHALDSIEAIDLVAEGEGYAAAEARLTIVDDELPTLTLSTSRPIIAEGDTLTLQVTAERSVREALTVTLTCDVRRRFTYASQVVIPAGGRTATVVVTAVNDDVPGLDETCTFTASAPRYIAGKDMVLVEDDDMPALELTLTPATVQEGAGPVSVAGTLRRTAAGGGLPRLTVRLSDDADGGLHFASRTLQLARGEAETHFTFGPVDNALVDGDRTYTVTAAVWISSCSCNAGGETGGSTSASLRVVDDDGPALRLTSSASTLLEGGAVTLTLTRNSGTATPLTVSLKADPDAGLDYSPTVTIPAGARSAEVVVKATANSTSGDNRTVVFTAEAEGHSTGTCWLMVTDRTLPDARVGLTSADGSSDLGDLPVGSRASLRASVVNDGASPLPEGVMVKVYRRGQGAAEATFYTPTPLEVGEETAFDVTVVLPSGVGPVVYYATVNEKSQIAELSYNNNTSTEIGASVISPFTARVATDKAVYQMGEKVAISGSLSGSGTVGAAVELYLMHDGYRQTIALTADASGRFASEWTPYGKQSGHYEVGACYPGEGLTRGMCTFDVYGLQRASDGYVACDVTEGETLTGSLVLQNPGRLALTGVKAGLVSVPGNCKASVTVPQTIGAGATAALSYSLTGTARTPENRWDTVWVRVTTKEGPTLDVPLYFYCRSAKAQLVAGIERLTTTMVKGASRDFKIGLTNYGRAATGKVSLSLPSFMKSPTGNTLASIGQNDTAYVVLSLTPTDDMQLNVPVRGQLAINCEHGDGVVIPYDITPVSESTGTLTVDVRDEYTYYTGEAPKVEGAAVEVRNPVTYALVAQGTTGSDGTWSVDLPEGYYHLGVTANDHDSYSNNIIVNPGVDTWKTVNLSIEALKISFEVEETTIDDTYEIVTAFTYETNVPVPEVLLEVPKRVEADRLQVGESLIFYATLTNKGLITAKDASLLLPTGFTHLTFEPLVAYEGLTIAPGQAITIPVLVTRVGTAASKGRRASEMSIDNDPCVGQPGTLYFWDCGNDRKWHRYKVAIQLGSCDSDDPSTWNPDTNPASGPGSNNEWHGGWPEGISVPNPPNTGEAYFHNPTSSSSSNVSVYEDKGCEPCQNEFMWELMKCIPGLGDIVNAVEKTGNAVSDGNKCLRAATRDIELVEKLRLCPFTQDYVDMAELFGALYRVLSNMANGEYSAQYNSSADGSTTGPVNSEVTNEDFDKVDDAMNEAVEALDEALKEIVKEATDELLDIAEEEVVTYLENKYPGYRAFHERAKELQQKLTTLAEKGKKVATKSSELNKKDKSDVIGVYESTLGLFDAAGSLLKELPATKKLGENMQSTVKKLNLIDCWVKLAKFNCEKEGASKMKGRRAKSAGNSARDSFLEAITMFTDMVEAGDAIKAEIFGDSIWMEVTIEELMPLYYHLISTDTQSDDISRYILKPQNVSFEQFDAFLERWYTMFNTANEDSDLFSLDKIKQYMDIIDSCEKYMSESGYEDFSSLIEDRYNELLEYDKENSVCASVKLAIPQTLALTRQAFRGTLTVYNGNGDTAMEDVRLTLVVTSEDGLVATPREFQIETETLTGFNGATSMDSGWTLDAKQTGVATIMFIPTKNAAPEKPVKWSFGGVLAYKDPFTGLEVRRELQPVTLTVNPSPELDLTYFLQRDVYGDDPLTEDVEPMHPAEFALVINNKGYGDARNVQMVTQQPQIVENEKGLLVDFEIIGSQVNGADANLVLGQTIANDFGTIEAQSQAYAQWWLQSSLLGHFTDYDVEATHVTSYGNPDLSLLDEVTIHELVHGFTVREASGRQRRGFLVNDVVDTEDLPDQVYFSDATQAGVTVLGTVGLTRRSDTEYVLPIPNGASGWVYGSLPDPTGGRRPLAGVSKLSDGEALPLDNVWQTDRTLRDGKEWLYEDRLHYVAYVSDGDGSLVLTFGSRPDVELAVERIDGAPDEGTLLTEPLTALTVHFNKPIKESSFTTDDLTLHCQGIRQDASRIAITRVDASTYCLDLTQATVADGFYVLTIQTTDIDDAEGYAGSEGRQVSWLQYADGDPFEGLIQLTDDALEVRLAPLPVRDWLYVTGNFSEVVQLDIYDMSGARSAVESHLRPGDAVYTGQLAAGFYVVSIVTDRGVWRTRVLKR